MTSYSVPSFGALLASQAAADEMEEGVTMPVTEYQKLVLRRVCRCSWSAHLITEFLAFLAAVSP